MKTPVYAVLLVYSTSHALRAEKILAAADIPCKLIPVPRQLSSDCGSCIRIALTDKARALDAVQTAQLEIAGVHDI